MPETNRKGTEARTENCIGGLLWLSSESQPPHPHPPVSQGGDQLESCRGPGAPPLGMALSWPSSLRLLLDTDQFHCPHTHLPPTHFFLCQQRVEIHKLRQGENLILGFSIGGGIDQDPSQNPFSEDKTDKVRGTRVLGPFHWGQRPEMVGLCFQGLHGRSRTLSSKQS